MNWDNKKEIFPTGKISGDSEINVEDIGQGTEKISLTQIYKARNMITKIESHEWLKNGEYKISTLYSLLESPMPDSFSCLNVYGKKVFLEEKEDARFNYTGI